MAGNQWACIELGSSMVATAISFAQQLSTVNTRRREERPAQVGRALNARSLLHWHLLHWHLPRWDLPRLALRCGDARRWSHAAAAGAGLRAGPGAEWITLVTVRAGPTQAGLRWAAALRDAPGVGDRTGRGERSSAKHSIPGTARLGSGSRPRAPAASGRRWPFVGREPDRLSDS